MLKMPGNKSLISLGLGSAIAATLGAPSIASATESPFAAQSLDKGYIVAESHRYDSNAGYGDKKDAYGDKKDRKYREAQRGMAMADTDNDGRVSKDEHARHAETMFERMDTNKDGYIDKDEAGAMKKRYRHDHGHGDSYRSGDRSVPTDEKGVFSPDVPMQGKREDDPPERQ